MGVRRPASISRATVAGAVLILGLVPSTVSAKTVQGVGSTTIPIVGGTVAPIIVPSASIAPRIVPPAGGASATTAPADDPSDGEPSEEFTAPPSANSSGSAASSGSSGTARSEAAPVETPVSPVAAPAVAGPPLPPTSAARPAIKTTTPETTRPTTALTPPPTTRVSTNTTAVVSTTTTTRPPTTTRATTTTTTTTTTATTTTRVPTTTTSVPPASSLEPEVRALAKGALRSFSVDGQTAVISLRADQLKLAQLFLQRYGKRVRIRLGNFAYPIAPNDATKGPVDCGTVPAPAPASSALRWSTRPSVLTVNSGADFAAIVSVANPGSVPVAYRAGNSITGVISRRGERTIVATFDGSSDGAGSAAGSATRTGQLLRGQSTRIVGLASTASCARKLGWALPPGAYDVRFIVGPRSNTPAKSTEATKATRATRANATNPVGDPLLVSTPFALTIT